MAIAGSIPDQIIYVCGKPLEVSTDLDINHFIENTIIEKHTVTPVFPVPAGNAKRLETAKIWALGRNYTPGPPNSVKEIQQKNDPFEIQLITLDFRGEGG